MCQFFSSHVDDFTAAQEEWENVQCVEPILKSPYKEDFPTSPKKYIDGTSSSPAKSPPTSPPALPPNIRVTPHTDFDEVWDFFTRQDMSHVMVGILVTQSYLVSLKSSVTRFYEERYSQFHKLWHINFAVTC